MKKAAFTFLFICFAVVNSFSQNKTFVSLSVMSGPSSVWSEADNKGDILGFGLDFKIGYRFGNHLQLSTGISWLKTGFTNKLDYAFPLVESEYYESYKFTHLLVPVELGYSFRLGNNLCLIPSINIGVGHPLSGNYFSQTDNIYEEKFNTQRLNNYHSFTFWAGTGMHLTYDITERIALMGGYQFNSIVTGFRKKSGFELNGEMMFVLGGDIGIRYSF